MRGDIADAATLARKPQRERFLQLTIDRLAQFFPAVDQIGDDDDPLAKVDILDDLMIGLGVIRLRAMRAALPAGEAAALDALLGQIGAAFRDHPPGTSLPDALLPAVDARIDAAAALDDRALGARYAVALTGLRLRLAADDDPFGTVAADEGEDAPAADADDHADVQKPSGP